MIEGFDPCKWIIGDHDLLAWREVAQLDFGGVGLETELGDEVLIHFSRRLAKRDQAADPQG